MSNSRKPFKLRHTKRTQSMCEVLDTHLSTPIRDLTKRERRYEQAPLYRIAYNATLIVIYHTMGDYGNVLVAMSVATRHLGDFCWAPLDKGAGWRSWESRLTVEVD